MKAWILTAFCAGLSVAATGAMAAGYDRQNNYHRDWNHHGDNYRHDNNSADDDQDIPNETWAHFLDREARLQDRLDSAVQAHAISMDQAYDIERRLANLQMTSLHELEKGSGQDRGVFEVVRRGYQKLSKRLRDLTGR